MGKENLLSQASHYVKPDIQMFSWSGQASEKQLSV